MRTCDASNISLYPSIRSHSQTMQHYRVQTYTRRSSSFVYVFVHSVMSVFVHIKPEVEEVLDQPKYFKIIFYFFYTLENCVMMLLPLLLKELVNAFPAIEVSDHFISMPWRWRVVKRSRLSPEVVEVVIAVSQVEVEVTLIYTRVKVAISQ